MVVPHSPDRMDVLQHSIMSPVDPPALLAVHKDTPQHSACVDAIPIE